MSTLNVLGQTSSTTLRGVATTPNSTCSFSACYFLNSIPATKRFFVLPTSCVVQLPPPTSTPYLIAPTTTGHGAQSTSTALELDQIDSYTPTPEIQHSQLMASNNQGSYKLFSPSTSPSVSTLLTLTTGTHVMVTTHVAMIPSFADITTSHVDMTASYVDIPPSSLSTNLKTTCTFFRCTPGYVAISIMATISFALLFLVTAIVSRFIQMHKVALERYAVMFCCQSLAFHHLLSAQVT